MKYSMKNRLVLAAVAALSFAQCQSAFAQQSTAPASKSGFAALFSSSNDDALIEPDLAFRLKVVARGPNTLTAELIPAKGYYLYKDKVRFTLTDSTGVGISSVKLPPGEIKIDKIFGKTEIYRSPIFAEIGLKRTPKANRLTLVASYQGCHEKAGVCYPPIEKTLNLTLP